MHWEAERFRGKEKAWWTGFAINYQSKSGETFTLHREVGKIPAPEEFEMEETNMLSLSRAVPMFLVRFYYGLNKSVENVVTTSRAHSKREGKFLDVCRSAGQNETIDTNSLSVQRQQKFIGRLSPTVQSEVLERQHSAHPAAKKGEGPRK